MSDKRKLIKNTSLSAAVGNLIAECQINGRSDIPINRLRRYFNLFGDNHIQNTIRQIESDIKEYNEKIDNIKNGENIIGAFPQQFSMYPTFQSMFGYKIAFTDNEIIISI